MTEKAPTGSDRRHWCDACSGCLPLGTQPKHPGVTVWSAGNPGSTAILCLWYQTLVRVRDAERKKRSFKCGESQAIPQTSARKPHGYIKAEHAVSHRFFAASPSKGTLSRFERRLLEPAHQLRQSSSGSLEESSWASNMLHRPVQWGSGRRLTTITAQLPPMPVPHPPGF